MQPQSFLEHVRDLRKKPWTQETLNPSAIMLISSHVPSSALDNH